MPRAAIGLGANLGDRLGALQGAVNALEGLTGVHVTAVSGVYETDPVGGPDQDDFLNAVAVIHFTVSPLDLLLACQAIEGEWHRTREVRWGPRTLDVDILSIDDVVSDDPVLTLPHPRAAERAFVCIPWLDADAEAAVPGVGAVREVVLHLDTSGVRPRPDLVLRLPERAT